jgi:hypothetical protein
VTGSRCEVIRRAEDIDDILATQVVPEHLAMRVDLTTQDDQLPGTTPPRGDAGARHRD